MAITVGANILARRVIHHIDEADSVLRRSFERLSSGARINRASDDAAGLAVSLRLRNQEKVLTRAKLNLGDAVSLLNIADAAADQFSILLTRMQELAAQSANGSFSRTQRAALQKEYAALDRELRRIGDTARFNRLALFEGTPAAANQASTVITGALTVAYDSSGTGQFAVGIRNAQGFVVDTVSGEQTLISVPSGYSGIGFLQISAGGDDVIFGASGGSAADLFHYDRLTGRTTKLTNSKSLLDGTQFAFSEDGSTVAFYSRTIYQDGGTVASASGVSATKRLNVLDLASGKLHVYGENFGNPVVLSISADGNHVAFESTTNITGENADGNSEVFLYSPGQGALRQLTITTGGATKNLRGVTDNGDAVFLSSGTMSLASAATGAVTTIADTVENARLSADGLTLYFISGDGPIGLGGAGLQLYSYRIDERKFDQLSADLLEAGHRGLIIAGDGSSVLRVNGTQTAITRHEMTFDAVRFDFEAGYGPFGQITALIDDLRSAVKGLGALTVGSASDARATLRVLSENLSRLGAARGAIGASLSRLARAESLLGSQVLEVRSAYDRVTSVDIAEETAALVRKDIQRSAATALLAQANQQPAIALSLLSDIEPSRR